MGRRVVLIRRSPVAWAIRASLSLGLLILAYVSVSWTFAYVLRTGDPERAYALAPADGRIAALVARHRIASSNDATTVVRLASDALQRDPTTVAAAATLGLMAETRGQKARARRMFAYAQSLSRRDLPTQLWAIEDAVARGDIGRALQHYDIALRTSRNGPDLLFPVLATAVAERSVRAALARTLVARPAWGDAFIYYVANDGPNPRATADLLRTIGRNGFRVAPQSRAAIVKLLIARNDVGSAWSYYAATYPEADRRKSRDARFMADPAVGSAFDWTPLDDAGVTASIQGGDRGGVFAFAVPASVGAPLLTQLQVLPPGQYRIEGHSTDVDQPAASLPFWALVCQDGRELGRVDVTPSAQRQGRFSGGFEVPANCPVQTLTLVARPSTAMAGTSGQIDVVRLAPEA